MIKVGRLPWQEWHIWETEQKSMEAKWYNWIAPLILGNYLPPKHPPEADNSSHFGLPQLNVDNLMQIALRDHYHLGVLDKRRSPRF